jgi:hypothetical protein
MKQAEKIFLARMVPHMLTGMSIGEAGRAVLADDERLWIAATEQSEQGEAIRDDLARQVYEGACA